MTELEFFIKELQKYADQGVTEIHPYISRDDDNYDAKMWIIKPLTVNYETGESIDNVIEIGMEER